MYNVGVDVIPDVTIVVLRKALKLTKYRKALETAAGMLKIIGNYRPISLLPPLYKILTKPNYPPDE